MSYDTADLKQEELTEVRVSWLGLHLQWTGQQRAPDGGPAAG